MLLLVVPALRMVIAGAGYEPVAGVPAHGALPGPKQENKDGKH